MTAENLRLLTQIITILGWAVVALSLIAAISQSAWLISYTQLAEDPLMLVIAGLALLANNILFFLSVIPVMIWIFLAHRNLHDAGMAGLRQAPAWATFSFLIPIVNLFVPFVAMRELANRSAGEPEELADATVDEVTAWWGCWIGSLVLGIVLMFVSMVDAIPGLYVTTPFWAHQVLMILQLVMTAGAAFFLIRLVRMVTQNQMAGANMVSAFD